MTNPGDAVGTNGGYGGRTSVNAFNDVLSAFTGRGIIKGWKCLPKSGMTVTLGGQDLVRDVAIAENDLGQLTTIDNISVQPIDITLSDGPTLGSRIDVIVAYVTNPPDSTGELIDNPDACGLIVVESSVTTNPTPADDTMIREAITADGGSGVTAYYVVLATIQIGTGANVITNTDINQGDQAKLTISSGSITGDQIGDNTITSQNMDWTTFASYSDSGTTSANIGATWTTIAEYTVPADGLYYLDMNIFSPNLGNKLHTLAGRFQLNGTTIRQFQDVSRPNYAGNHLTTLDGSFTRPLAAGDTITLQSTLANITAKLNYNFWVQQV